MDTKLQEYVNIRPGVSILSVLKHIQYDPWFALAEFVDNSIDSYLKHEEEIKTVKGEEHKLTVKIEINEQDNKIAIFDNAAGISKDDYSRAFRAAEIPPDSSGLSEFGMGMKSAACWFSDLWTVKTTALGENELKTVTFDLAKIFHDKLEELKVVSKPIDPNTHFTVIELHKIGKMPIKKTKTKIKDHLASIYRHFIRNGVLDLWVDNELLRYKDPKVLTAPYPYNSKNKAIYWRREIDLEIEPNSLYVRGFVGLRETMSNTESGFALFRRGRVIEGSVDEGFRPKKIMGDVGSPEYKRIFGELHLEGFEVSFTKRGIKWDENMDIFLDALRDDLNHPTFPLIKQAREYRTKPTRAEIQKVADAIVKHTVDDLEKLGDTVDELQHAPPEQTEAASLTETVEISNRDFEFDFNDTKWLVSVELTYDKTIGDWIEVGDHLIKQPVEEKDIRQIGLRMSLSHPFIERFAGTDKARLEPILRIAAALGLAEVSARVAGVKHAGTIRMNLNRLLASISKDNEE